jgi:hypothetical protein
MASVNRATRGEDAPVDVHATAQVRERAGRYQAALHVQTPQGAGERTLEHADCAILAESVALVIALCASGQLPANSAPARRAPPRLALAAHAAAVSGTLPQLALGAGADLTVAAPWALRAELSATLFLEQEARYSATPTVGATFGLLRVAARVCRGFSVASFELGPCAGMQLQRIAADGFGGVLRDAGAALLLAPTLGLLVRLPVLRPLALRLALEVAVPLQRRRFVYTDLAELHRPDALAAQLFIAPEVLF